MLPLLFAAAMKHFAVDKPKEDRELRRESSIARWSPWTGMKPKSVNNPSLFNTMLQAYGAGSAMGGGFGGGSQAAGAGATGGGAVNGPTTNVWDKMLREDNQLTLPASYSNTSYA